MSQPRATPPKEVVPGIKVNDQPRNPFDFLPTETVQQIAEFLESDSSLCNFQISCRSARDAIDGDNFSLWRRRFISNFEPTGWSQRENIRYKNAYHDRRKLLKNGAIFHEGRTSKERKCLELMRELIAGAFANDNSSRASNLIASDDPIDPPSESRNINRLMTFLKSTNLLTSIFKPAPQTGRHGHPTRELRPEPLLHTTRVICAPALLSLNEHFMHDHFGFPDCQQAVYSSVATQPFFNGRCGLDIDMEFVLRNINFWRYHMVRSAEQTLFTAFNELGKDARPQWWTSQLKQGGKALGKYWKGSYAYLDPDVLEQLRERSDKEDYAIPIQDIFAGEDAAFSFQDMELHVVEDRKMLWPDIFERTLNSLTPPPPRSPTGMRTRAQKRSGTGGTPEEVEKFKPLSFRFHGNGSDSEESFLASGWLNPLPPQQGIPGWQRLTMMKYFVIDDEDDEAASGADSHYGANVDWDALWAYEGVVLPGGKIVVGRWWSPSSGTEEQQYSGPFVLWCVDGAEGYNYPPCGEEGA